MILITLYLIRLFIAPHVWFGPLIGFPADRFLLLAWLVYIVVSGRVLHLFRWRAQDWCFLAFVLWSALTVFANGLPQSGQDVVYFLAYFFAIYRLTVASAGNRTGVRRAAHLLVLFGLVLAVEGIHHYWSGDGLGWAGQALGWVDEAAAGVGLDKRTRWVYIFDGPGVFCVVYTIPLPFLLQFLGPPYSWISRIAAVAPLAALLLAIYYTGSRGGWITTLVLIGAWAAVTWKLSLPKVAAVGLLAILFVIVGPAYLTNMRDSSRSAQHRVDMWAEGIEMVQQNPILGVGRGQFAEYTGTLIAHNSAIQIMGEAGFVGLFLWIGIIYTGSKNLLYAIREADDATDRAYSLSLLCSIGGYLVSSMFVTLEYETFYFLLALAAATGDDQEEPPRFRWLDAAAVLVVMFTFFIMLKVFVMAYPRLA